MINRLFYTIHRILGTILSLMFLVWFLSGFVMIYHKFPKVSPKERYTHMDVLQTNALPYIKSIISAETIDTISEISLKSLKNQTYFEIKTTVGKHIVPMMYKSDTSSKLPYTVIEKYAKKWCHASIIKVDTLYELDQWIPFGRLKNDFPIYKFHFNDTNKHQLYVSSITGQALQFTNKNNRFWAWVGAIPHWVYFTSLRQNTEQWKTVVVTLSALGSVMCLTGLILGIRILIKQYKRKRKFKSPYRKYSYKWHHILGFIFGIFVFTFIFSGMMSLAKVPNWIVKTHNPVEKKLAKSNIIKIDTFILDYRKVIEKYSQNIKSIEWTSFGKTPIYKIIVNNSLIMLDASTNEIKELYLNEHNIKDRLCEIHSENMNISLLHEYDNYYVGLSNHLPLPVYKINVDDKDNSTYYINPKNGTISYYNKSKKVRHWTYQALHSFKIGFLVKHPIIWNIVMWITMIGGTFVSITGVWLSFKYLKRKIKKVRKKFAINKN